MTKNIFRAMLGIFATVIVASNASAALVNGGFEDPNLGGGDFQCTDTGSCPGWTSFGAAFIVDESIPTGFGSQALKVFGGTSGVYQQLAATAGQTWTATVDALNWSGDLLAGAQIGAVNIEWIAADAVTNIGTAFGGTIDASTPLDVIQALTASGVAPAGTAFARIVLITGDFGDPGTGGGSAFFDNASLEQTVVPVPAALWLMGSGLLGLMGLRRKKA